MENYFPATRISPAAMVIDSFAPRCFAILDVRYGWIERPSNPDGNSPASARSVSGDSRTIGPTPKMQKRCDVPSGGSTVTVPPRGRQSVAISTAFISNFAQSFGQVTDCIFQ